eukprot:9504099-Pyramimonas_sp.AAC.2
MLRCAMLCYAVLRCATLCYAVLCCTTLCCAVLRYAAMCYAVLRCTALCYAVLRCATLRYAVLRNAATKTRLCLALLSRPTDHFSQGERQVRAQAVYPLAARINHACMPNVARFDYVVRTCFTRPARARQPQAAHAHAGPHPRWDGAGAELLPHQPALRRPPRPPGEHLRLRVRLRPLRARGAAPGQ